MGETRQLRRSTIAGKVSLGANLLIRRGGQRGQLTRSKQPLAPALPPKDLWGPAIGRVDRLRAVDHASRRNRCFPVSILSRLSKLQLPDPS
jgi:hypothetical protein